MKSINIRLLDSGRETLNWADASYLNSMDFMLSSTQSYMDLNLEYRKLYTRKQKYQGRSGASSLELSGALKSFSDILKDTR